VNDAKHPHIEKLLPHRYPFLFIDRIVEVTPGKRGVCLKKLTANDYFFNLTGGMTTTVLQVMMIEGLAQTAAVVSHFVDGGEFNPNPTVGFMVAIDNFIFLKNPQPGDQLHFHVELTRQYGNLHRFNVWIMAEDEEIARGELTFAIS
jgi:3-hydroxyacyl-[acyl-carrier-protein] dehydratase